MNSVKADDMDALSVLYERYKGPLFGFFYNYSKDQMLAEDHVQSVFIRVLKYKHTYRGDGKFKAWLFQMARNINVDHYRKNKNPAVELSESHDLVTEPHDSVIEKEQQLSTLERALDSLDADKKELLILSKLKNMAYRDIGEIYNCTENTVKIKVFRALKALRKQYELIEIPQ